MADKPLAGGLDQLGTTAEAYRKAAKNLHVSGGTLEIDSNAIVSQSDDGGAYVQSWIWVDDDAAGVCRTCRALYDQYGDGYDGECPDCADKTEHRRELAGAVKNAEETLADALDDTSCLGPQEKAAHRAEVARAKKALADYDKENQ